MYINRKDKALKLIKFQELKRKAENKRGKDNVRVSDVLSEDGLDVLDLDGLNVRIRAGAGKGKSYWAINTLGEEMKRKKAKMLIVTHRVRLKEQFQEMVKKNNADEFISITTYQSLAKQQIEGKDVVGDMFSYSYIVYDEVHFIQEESSFNKTTEVNREIINNVRYSGTITQFFLSANSIVGDNIEYDIFLNFSDLSKSSYDISDRVDRSFIIKKNDSIRGIIDAAIKNNEKVAVFVNNTKLIMKLKEEYRTNSTVIVSKSSKAAYLMDEDEEDVDRVLKEQRFENDILLATSAIDAGVSLKMEDLKHIIVSDRDIRNIYQFIGRKRMKDKNDRFNIYIMNFNNMMIGGTLAQVENKLNKVKLFNNSKDIFLMKYGRSIDNYLFYVSGDGEVKVNKEAYNNLANQYEYYNQLLDVSFKKYLELKLNIKLINMEIMKEEQSLEEYLAANVGKEFITKNQKEEVIAAFNIKRNGRIVRGIGTFNGYLKDKKYNYKIISKSTRRKVNNGEYKRFRVWIIEEVRI